MTILIGPPCPSSTRRPDRIETKDTRRFPNDPHYRPGQDQWTPVHDPAQSSRNMRPPETGRRAVQRATRARLPRKNPGNDKASSEMWTFELEHSREGRRNGPAEPGALVNRSGRGAMTSARGGPARVRAGPVVAFQPFRVTRSVSGTAVREPGSARLSAARAEQLDGQARASGRTAVLVSARRRPPPPCGDGPAPPRPPSSAGGISA